MKVLLHRKEKKERNSKCTGEEKEDKKGAVLVRSIIVPGVNTVLTLTSPQGVTLHLVSAFLPIGLKFLPGFRQQRHLQLSHYAPCPLLTLVYFASVSFHH